MSGLNRVGSKLRREVRRRNHIAKDLRTSKYRPRIRESNKHHLIDEVHEREADEDYWFYKKLGLTSL